MIPREWYRLARPLPGKLWVQRAEQPMMRGRIVLPDGAHNYRRMTRSAEAFVVASETPLFRPTQHVLLADIVGREIQFGFRGELKILEISPYQILAIVEEADGKPLVLQADLSRDVAGEGIEANLQEPAFAEGSTEGLL